MKVSGSAPPFAISVNFCSHSAVSMGEVSGSGRIVTRLIPALWGSGSCPYVPQIRLSPAFDDSSAGGGRTQSLPLGILRRILLARILHSGQEGIFGIGLRRLGEMLGNSNLRTIKNLPFGEVRERAAVPIRRLFLQEGTENAVDFPPAFGKDALALCGEGVFAAVKVAVTASYSYGSADAHSSLQQTNSRRFRSPTGSNFKSAFQSP